MSQAMFDGAEEVSVNGKTIKSAQTWSLYNPAATVLTDDRGVDLICPGSKLSNSWYNTHLFGYPGYPMHRYLTDDREMVMERMKDGILSKDELIFAHWVYTAIKDKGDLNKQIAYQMPEDFLVSFDLQDLPLVDENDTVMVRAILKLQPVQRLSEYELKNHPELSNANREEIIPVYFMKPLFLWLLRRLVDKRGLKGEWYGEVSVNLPNVTMAEVYQLYMEQQDEYWKKIESDDASTVWLTSDTTEGFIPGGKKYTLTTERININHL